MFDSLQKRILIAEDDDALRDALRDYLSLSFPGFFVDAAFNGRQLVAFAYRNPYAAIVTDHNMPGITGLEALPDLRRLHPTIPIVMLSAGDPDGRVDLRVQAHAAGITVFLEKPVDPLLLCTTLQSYLLP